MSNSQRFEEWLRELDEDVIQGEYGYEPGEFTVYPDLWMPAFKAGQTPREAFDGALEAYDDDRKARDEEAKARWAEIQRKDAEAIVAWRAGQ
jgi:hypothetical protein